MSIVYRYNARKNPDEGTLAGVPLRDLTDADLARLDEYMRASVAACPFYVAVDETAEHTPAAVVAAATRSRASRPSETKATEPE